MKTGKKVKVWVLRGREVFKLEGEILATRQGHHIRAGFTHPDYGHLLIWFRKKNTVRFGGKRYKYRCSRYFHKGYSHFQAKYFADEVFSIY